MSDSTQLTAYLREQAMELGFELVGACPAVTPTGYHRLLEWLERGYAGEMQYLPNRAHAYQHPNSVLPGVTSILMLGMNYYTSPRNTPTDGQGSVASYAWGEADYHDVIRERLNQLLDGFAKFVPTAKCRGVVDTAPLLEREFAQLAGLGWIGKNTLLLNRQFGSYFFLAALLTDAELDYDDPFPREHCGTCTACLDQCPTRAFPEPFVLDATRCISYLTIEHRSMVDVELAAEFSGWLFGCDICQEVCPWNHRLATTSVAEFQPQEMSNPVDLIALFDLDDEQFRERFRHTPLWRSKRRGILRNAALVLGAQACHDAVSALRGGMNDEEPVVRDACQWALDRIANRTEG